MERTEAPEAQGASTDERGFDERSLIARARDRRYDSTSVIVVPIPHTDYFALFLFAYPGMPFEEPDVVHADYLAAGVREAHARAKAHLRTFRATRPSDESKAPSRPTVDSLLKLLGGQ